MLLAGLVLGPMIWMRYPRVHHPSARNVASKKLKSPEQHLPTQMAAKIEKVVQREPAREPANSESPPLPASGMRLRAVYETTDENREEITDICLDPAVDDRTFACRQVALYYARIGQWNQASTFAEAATQDQRLNDYILLAKIAWKQTGDVELTIYRFAKGCEGYDGEASPYIETEEFGTLVRTDRLACAQLRKFADPRDGWNSILSMKYGTDGTFADYFEKEFD